MRGFTPGLVGAAAVIAISCNGRVVTAKRDDVVIDASMGGRPETKAASGGSTAILAGASSGGAVAGAGGTMSGRQTSTGGAPARADSDGATTSEPRPRDGGSSMPPKDAGDGALLDGAQRHYPTCRGLQSSPRDAAADGCHPARFLLRCMYGGAGAVCKSDVPDMCLDVLGQGPGKCEDVCAADEYAVSCGTPGFGGVRDVTDAAPPSTCAVKFGFEGTSFYCCPCE
jgi:hypothetical protein